MAGKANKYKQQQTIKHKARMTRSLQPHFPLLYAQFFCLLFHPKENPEKLHPWEDEMSGYDSLAWSTERNGKEHVCPIDVLQGDTNDRLDLNQIIGTGRW